MPRLKMLKERSAGFARVLPAGRRGGPIDDNRRWQISRAQRMLHHATPPVQPLTAAEIGVSAYEVVPFLGRPIASRPAAR